MKLILQITFSLIFVLPSFAQDQNLPKTITVLGKTLSIKENKSDSIGFIAEYIAENETFNNWTTMFAIRFVPGKELDPMSSAVETSNKVKERKAKGDHIANSIVLQSNDKKSIAVDFFISDHNIYEHNIWRYLKTDKGLVSYQIARRLYSINSDEIKKFISTVPDAREKILEEITNENLPIPNDKAVTK